jgi:signal transduction histidine kinase
LELGSELISSDIIAFYELIKNGFDARTTSGVEINFNIVLRRAAYLKLSARAQGGESDISSLRAAALESLNADAPSELLDRARVLLLGADTLRKFIQALKDVYSSNSIVVADTGSGMSATDLSDNFLLLGTPSRKREVDEALRLGALKSPFLGEKGIGRLSAMRLGDRLRVETARRNDKRLNILDIDWSMFANLDAMLDEISIVPTVGAIKPSTTWSGTNLAISELSEDWTSARVRRMAEYDFARITDPFLDQKERPRIVIFWNGERLTIPWMTQSLLDHAHARISGTYEIVEGMPRLRCATEALGLGFEHPKEVEQVLLSKPDLESVIIGTTQEVPDNALVSVGPFKFEMHWYNRRRLGSIDGIGEMRQVRELQGRWSGILLFRDGYRVLPYGDDEDDWLALDRKALRRSGYALNKTQFIGRVQISRTANPELVDQTNREGLRETPEQRVFLGVLQYAIQDCLFRFMTDVAKRYKNQEIAPKLDLSDAKSEVGRLEARAKTALKRLRKLTKDEGKDAIEDLQQTLFEFAEFAERARLRIEEVEHESRQMIDMAGVGLMVEVVAHELARASENAIENLEILRGKDVPDDVRARLESLRAEMKSLSKRVRILDPLSVSGRQRFESFSLDELIRETLDAHDAQFKRHRIRVKIDVPSGRPIRVHAVKGMVVQIIENLLSNSKYWLQMRAERDTAFKPRISVTVHNDPPSMIYEDNGPGIAPENVERVFRAFFSLKEKSKRRGLGLFIARECAEFGGGTLVLDDHRDSITGRLHRFTLELPDKVAGR